MWQQKRMMAESAVLLAVSAEVLFHDGANWIRLDNATNGLQSSHGLSTIQLIKVAHHESIYRIVAIRGIDNKRIVDQAIFHRLKYKEATPSFHQWRNEHKQVIGLNFSNEQDARHFYLAVRQALESVINLTPTYSSTQKSQDAATYQDPQNFHSNYGYQQQQQQDIYANHQEPAYADATTKLNGYMDSGHGQRIIGKCPAPQSVHQVNQQQQQQQQQNLIRRSSQGSNISSSTGGSLPGPLQRQAPPLNNNNQLNDANHCVYAPPSSYTPPAPQQQFDNSNGTAVHQHNVPVAASSTSDNSSSANAPRVQASNGPPPPPPPPPPELKNALSAAKQQSFADQLRLVQLRKNSTGAEKLTHKPSPTSANNPIPALNSNGNGTGPPPAPKLPSGNQDFISELADKLNKRKLTSENSSGGTTSNTPPRLPQPPAMTAPKNSTQPTISHKKIPSGSSLSSQEDANSLGGTTNSQTPGNPERNGQATASNNNKVVTTEDLARLKSEITEAFTEELSRLKSEMTQTIRNEIAKLISQK